MASLLFLRRLSTSTATSHAFDPTIRRLARSKDTAAITAAITSSSLPPSSAITNYVSSSMLDSAISILTNSPSLTNLNSLLSACNHHPSLFRSVPDLLAKLSADLSISPNSLTNSILIKSLCRSRRSHDAIETLKGMKDANVVTYTTILDSLYKENKVDRAEALWNEIVSKEILPDTPAYNVRISNKKSPGEVLAVIDELQEKGLTPDTITWNYLIVAYVRVGKFEEAKKVYEEMGEKGCEVSYATYRGYLMALCKKGEAEKAAGVLEDAVKRGKVPDLGTVKMVVARLMNGKKVRSAKRAVTGLRHKYKEDFVGGWKELEKMVGLDKEGEEDQALVAPA